MWTGKVMSKRKTIGENELNKFYKVKYDLNNLKGITFFRSRTEVWLLTKKNGFTGLKYYV
jgi:hypothetical protein